MSEEITFLLTLLNPDDTLLRVCLCISKPREILTGDCAKYPMETENNYLIYCQSFVRLEK